MNLSIIISVFNLEKYIAKCIDSFFKQDISADRYEIIIIDDGSTDNSSKIIKEYILKYHNVSYYYKENGGVSSARNLGLKYAKGKYIWFFDGDDYIVPNCLKEIVEYITKNDLDILYIKYKRIDENDINSSINAFKPNFDNKIYNGVDFFAKAEGDFLMVWRYIFKNELFQKNNLAFFEGIIHEDVEFTHRILYYSEKIGVCNSAIYNYIIRGNSIMRSINKEKEFQSIKAIILSIQHFRKTINNSLYKNYLNRYLQQIISNYFFFKIIHKDYSIDTIKEIKYILNLERYSGMGIKKFVQYIFISKFPIVYFYVIKLLYNK